MEQHGTPVRRLWQYSKLNVSNTRSRAGEPQRSQFFIPVLAWTATVAEVLVHISVGDILVGLQRIRSELNWTEKAFSTSDFESLLGRYIADQT